MQILLFQNKLQMTSPNHAMQTTVKATALIPSLRSAAPDCSRCVLKR